MSVGVASEADEEPCCVIRVNGVLSSACRGSKDWHRTAKPVWAIRSLSIIALVVQGACRSGWRLRGLRAT